MCMERYRLLATLTLEVMLMSKPVKGLITAEADAALGGLRGVGPRGATIS